VLDRTAVERQAQAVRVSEAQAAVYASLAELKRLDVLAERRAARRRDAAMRRERRELDELATLRHGRSDD
jgi:flagellar biosynthesis chaperone FliJ